MELYYFRNTLPDQAWSHADVHHLYAVLILLRRLVLVRTRQLDEDAQVLIARLGPTSTRL